MPWTCPVSHAKLIVDPETEPANAEYQSGFPSTVLCCSQGRSLAAWRRRFDL